MCLKPSITVADTALHHNILLFRPQIQDTGEEIGHSWYLPCHGFLRDMTIFKVEGQGIYIFETPSQEYPPESHTNVMFLQTPLRGGSPAIPLVRTDYCYVHIVNSKQ